MDRNIVIQELRTNILPLHVQILLNRYWLEIRIFSGMVNLLLNSPISDVSAEHRMHQRKAEQKAKALAFFMEQT
jgi:hypothetical protein